MGTPSYATNIFKNIVKNDFEVVALFTQQDKPFGRKQIVKPPHIKEFVIQNGFNFPIFQPDKLKNNQEMVSSIKDLKPDFIIVAAYGQILPRDILDIAPCINLHASLLPLYRGASPIQEALINDDNYTGVTAMLMEEGLDTGDILGLKYLEITKSMEVSEVFDVLSKVAGKLIVTILKRFGSIQQKKQNEINASICKKIKKENGKVDFFDAEKIYLKYKAYSYWPGIFLESGLKLQDISLLESSSENKNGHIIEIGIDFIVVGCKKGSLKIKTIQAPSKKAINSIDYIRGHRLNINDIIK